MVSLSGILEGAGAVAGEGVAKAQRALNQSINISVGDIDVKQIIKYCFYLAIICGIVLFLITAVRGFALMQEGIACGIANTGCDWWLIGSGDCKDCNPKSLYSYTWGWGIEWWWRCLLYLTIALPIFLILYKWFMKLASYILRVDYHIKRIENWIYGTELEGEAERQMQTRL